MIVKMLKIFSFLNILCPIIDLCVGISAISRIKYCFSCICGLNGFENKYDFVLF